MARPDIACLCVEQGIHAALTVAGEHRDRLIADFQARHSGPGHLQEDPPRDWYGKEAALRRHLQRVRETLQHAAVDWPKVSSVAVKGERL